MNVNVNVPRTGRRVMRDPSRWDRRGLRALGGILGAMSWRHYNCGINSLLVCGINL